MNNELVVRLIPNIVTLTVITVLCFTALFVGQKGYLKNHLKLLWSLLTASLLASIFIVNNIIEIVYINNGNKDLPRWLSVSEGVFLWLIPALMVAKIIDKFFWGGVIKDILRHQPPALARYLTYAVILFSVTVAIVTNVFESSMTGLLATSGLLAGIVGFAMQLNLSNMFAALAINVDRPFTIGDWIGYKDIEGEVIKISWRATKIRTRSQNLVSIPNRSIIYEKVENFSAPKKNYAITIDIHVDASHPPFLVKKRLQEACETCPRVIVGHPIRIFILEINDWSMTYRCLVPFEDYQMAPENQDNLWSAVWYALTNTNISFAVKKTEMDFYRGIKERRGSNYEMRDLLREMDIFTPLKDEDIDFLAENIKEHQYDADALVCREGQAADSMYVIKQGTVTVSVITKSKREIEVAKIGPGGFFGEISLFTGKPRTATVKSRRSLVVFEISKHDLAPILEKRPELSKQFSQIILGRKNQLSSIFKTSDQQQKDIRALVDEIRKYFNIHAPASEHSSGDDKAA